MMAPVHMLKKPITPPATGQKAALEVEIVRGWSQVEKVLGGGELLRAWEHLLEKDSTASIFQTPLWCLIWYKCYQDTFEAFLLIARDQDQLVGLAPLARTLSDGSIVFAGDDMTDYCDFLCTDESKESVLECFLPIIMSESRTAFFVVGQTQPQSQTVDLVKKWADHGNVGTITRTHPCWRFKIGSQSEVNELYKKKTLRQAVAYYQRRGELKLRRIREEWEWVGIRDRFFQQHCLRQAFAERNISFTDPRKREFYSELFNAKATEVHFTGLWAGDNPISFMFCFSFKGVLYYGAPSFDPTEHKRSPGLVHILEIIRQCHKEGYREVDLTLGSSPFKARFGNYCVSLPSIYIYRSRWGFWVAILKKWILDRAKVVACKLTGTHQGWERARSAAFKAFSYWRLVMRTSPRQIMSESASAFQRLFFFRRTAQFYRLRKEEFVPSLRSEEGFELRTNKLEDFLTLEEKQPQEIVALIQMAIKRIDAGNTLHTGMANGLLAHYCWTRKLKGPILLDEAGVNINVGTEDSILLFDFYIAERFRESRWYYIHLTGVLQNLFTSGAAIVYIKCDRRDASFEDTLASLGFKLDSIHRFTNVLIWKRKSLTRVCKEQ